MTSPDRFNLMEGTENTWTQQVSKVEKWKFVKPDKCDYNHKNVISKHTAILATSGEASFPNKPLYVCCIVAICNYRGLHGGDNRGTHGCTYVPPAILLQYPLLEAKA